MKQLCEIPGHKGMAREAEGKFQVFDDTMRPEPMPTMSRPAWMCSACLTFAKKCGMRPEEVK